MSARTASVLAVLGALLLVTMPTHPGSPLAFGVPPVAHLIPGALALAAGMVGWFRLILFAPPAPRPVRRGRVLRVPEHLSASSGTRTPPTSSRHGPP